MNETKARVSKLKGIHLSKLASNPEMTLSQLHMLTKPKKKVKKSTNVDSAERELNSELLKHLQNKITQHYSAATDIQPNVKASFDSVLFFPESVANFSDILNDKYKLQIIRDSYDKFRRESEINESDISYENHHIENVTNFCNLNEIYDVDEEFDNDFSSRALGSNE